MALVDRLRLALTSRNQWWMCKYYSIRLCTATASYDSIYIMIWWYINFLFGGLRRYRFNRVVIPAAVVGLRVGISRGHTTTPNTEHRSKQNQFGETFERMLRIPSSVASSTQDQLFVLVTEALCVGVCLELPTIFRVDEHRFRCCCGCTSRFLVYLVAMGKRRAVSHSSIKYPGFYQIIYSSVWMQRAIQFVALHQHNTHLWCRGQSTAPTALAYLSRCQIKITRAYYYSRHSSLFARRHSMLSPINFLCVYAAINIQINFYFLLIPWPQRQRKNKTNEYENKN